MLQTVTLCCIVAGCAGQPTAAPRLDIFSKVQPPAIDMPAPTQLPARPKATAAGLPAAPLMVFTVEGARQLLARDQVCEANTEIAGHCAAGFTDLERSYALLLHEARLLEGQHNYMAERWAQAEEQLRRREREQLIESWLSRIAIALLAATALH